MSKLDNEKINNYIIKGHIVTNRIMKRLIQVVFQRMVRKTRYYFKDQEDNQSGENLRAY